MTATLDRPSASAPQPVEPDDELESPRRPVALAILLIVGGILGLAGAFALTVEKFAKLENPGAQSSCYFSVLVQCDKNLSSWQGEVFGFPNPLLGLIGFMAPVVVGMAVLAGARFARWFWVAFNVGLLGAMAFVVFLISQSIYSLFTLCPWCMVVWAATIPMFLATTFFNASAGHFGQRLRRIGSALYGWTPLITLGAYLVVAVLAQLRLDVLNNLL